MSQVTADYLDGEFNLYLRMARHYITQMSSPEDRRVAEIYIKSCLIMKKSDQMKTKFHRNRFFRYFLKTIRKTVESPTPAVFINQTNFDNMNESTEENGNVNEFHQWSANRKSYVSAKILPGRGALIYMACTEHPDECGWTENGFASFAADISDVPTPAEASFSAN